MTWRLFVTPGAPGAYNMAVDEVLSRRTEGSGKPFLRFYFWDPPALSLGRFQNPTWGLKPDADGLDRVRRPTGGGAIWHADELTYSLGCPADLLPVRGVKASFELLTQFLLVTWRRLGWEACWAKDYPGLQGHLGLPTAACFSGHEEYDILVGGRKLGGNAQSRSGRTIFQHGSLPITLDWSVLERLFDSEQVPSRDFVTSLSEQGWNRPKEDLISELIKSFENCLDVQFESCSLSEDEQSEVESLVASKHGNKTWIEGTSGIVRNPGTAKTPLRG